MDPESLRIDPALRSEIAADEGTRSIPYKDSVGVYTGGIGHNLMSHGLAGSIAGWIRSGIPSELIQQWFTEDIDAAVTCCSQVFDGFADYPDEAQRVLANMAFDLMYELWQWPGLRGHVAAHQWKSAATDILHSRFAEQASHRCQRLADRLRAIG